MARYVLALDQGTTSSRCILFGQACFTPGMAKCTYGTGGFLLMNTGEQPQPSDYRLLSTIAWNDRGRTSYAPKAACSQPGPWFNGCATVSASSNDPAASSLWP